MPKGQMRGGVDPAELGRKGAEARRRKEAERAAAMGRVEPAGDVDPWAVVRGIASNKSVPAYVRTQAAKILMQLPAAPEEAEWKRSVQVRPDFSPPSWDEVRSVMDAAGVS